METAKQNVFVRSSIPSEFKEQVIGYDFESIKKNNYKVDYDALFNSYKTTGYQATNFGLAVEEIEKMINWRLSDEPIEVDEVDEYKDPKIRANVKCRIFLGYTSNLVSAGLRETIRFLVEEKMVDVLVTTAGGVEEDLIKCLAPTLVGDFNLPGKDLRQRGINRVGNLLVPNDNYCKFEDWIMPIFDQMLKEQKEKGIIWSPSTVINRLGKEINHPSSIYYWAYKNNIPVFCPALTDGSLGDMLYFHSYKNPGLIIDLVSDIRAMNNQAVFAKHTGVIILGGGVIKHHICNANLMRNGCDFAVYLNTGQEFDGSDSGARPDEAVSWGKIKTNARPVKVYAEATLIFPLLVAQTFAKHLKRE